MVHRARVWAALILVTANGCGESDSSPVDNAGSDAAVDPPDVVAEAQDSPDVVVGDAQGTYRLTVTGGFGSGTYASGQRVHVWADLRPWTEFLTGWSGDATLLDYPDEWHGTLIMPARDVTLSSTIEVRDEVFAESVYKGSTQIDKAVIGHVPSQPRGLLFMLHGTGGSADVIQKSEARYVALAAVARGYGVVSTEAEEVVAGDLNGDQKIRWNAAVATGNIDMANLNALVARLRQQGVIDASTPLFVVGMSNGGAMSVSLGAVADAPVAAEYPNLRFRAAASHCASGRPGAAAISTTPTAWLLCANDDNDEVSNDEARNNSAALEARGIDTFVDEHPASPLYDERFLRIEGGDEATSKKIANELRAGGFVGEDGMFLLSSEQMILQVEAQPGDFPTLVSLTGGAVLGLREQIRVMMAEHQMYSDWANRMMDFFDAHRE
jgi:predicted esterase